MGLTDNELGQIVAKASSLGERLNGEFVPVGDGGSLAQHRLDRWQQLTGSEETYRVADLLTTADGKKAATRLGLLSYLGEVERRPQAPWPTWALTLKVITEAISSAFAKEGETLHGSFHRSHLKGLRLPFEDLLWPIADDVWRQMEQAESSGASRCNENARLGLQRHLLRRIARIVSVPIHTTFLAYKAIQGSGQEDFAQTAWGSETSSAHAPDSRYRSFVRQQGGDGLRRFFRRFPVAARLVSQVTEDWLENTGQLLKRLDRDRDELSGCFNHGKPLTRVVSIQPGCSDPHNRGQTVALLTFSGGLKLAYKPRSMRIDQTFFELVGRLNASGLKPPLRILRIVDHGSYGWMEFAQHIPCANLSAAKRYYQRAGALIGLVHWAHGIDGHSENVIAAGEDPVLVDLEALAHPLYPGETAMDTAMKFGDLKFSILRTGLLPVKDWRDSKHRGSDHSGLDGPTTWVSQLSSVRWKQVNTDNMSWTKKKPTLRHPKHRARLGKRLLSMRAFEHEVLDGYRVLVKLLTGPAESEFRRYRALICQAARRRVVNATVVYGAMIQSSLAPRCLIWGVDRSIEFLALPVRHASDWSQEIAQLERLDVPYFQFSPTPTEFNLMAEELPCAAAMNDQIGTLKLAIHRRLGVRDGVVLPRQAVSAPIRRRRSAKWCK